MRRLRCSLRGALALALLPAASCVPLAQQAANGDVKAQFRYARALLQGDGLSKDPARAVIWFRVAAEQGHPKAMAAMGLCHEKGFGTGRNEAEARRWYTLAEKSGDTDASFMLAGMDMRQGKREAVVRRLDKLCQKHDLAAECTLARYLMEDDSPIHHPGLGIRYLRYAALDGMQDAALLLSICYKEGIGVKRCPELADGWFRFATEGSPTAAPVFE